MSRHTSGIVSHELLTMVIWQSHSAAAPRVPLKKYHFLDNCSSSQL